MKILESSQTSYKIVQGINGYATYLYSEKDRHWLRLYISNPGFLKKYPHCKKNLTDKEFKLLEFI